VSSVNLSFFNHKMLPPARIATSSRVMRIELEDIEQK
jgi:hypothetical protein